MKKSVSFYPKNEDIALFLLIKRRDKEAFAAVYQKYHAYLYALAVRYLKNSALAEDAVQHVFVKLWETTQNIDVEINLKNYLYTMTKNYILNQFRNNREMISLNYVNAQQAFVSDCDVGKRLEDTQIMELLHEAIDELPLQKKMVCKKKIDENKSNQQIANEMNISVHTVKSHYQEAIKMLRNYFEKIKLIFL